MHIYKNGNSNYNYRLRLIQLSVGGRSVSITGFTVISTNGSRNGLSVSFMATLTVLSEAEHLDFHLRPSPKLFIDEEALS
jgi:hypothetical protein